MKRNSILFIRAVPVPVAIEALRALRKSHPDTQITVLTSPAAMLSAGNPQLADGVVAYSALRFGVRAAGLPRLWRLRRMKFGTVIVPFIGVGHSQFWNVGRMALLLGGAKTIWLACEENALSAGLQESARVSWSECWRPLVPVARIRRRLAEKLKRSVLWVLYGAGMLLFAGIAALLVPDAASSIKGRNPGR